MAEPVKKKTAPATEGWKFQQGALNLLICPDKVAEQMVTLPICQGVEGSAQWGKKHRQIRIGFGVERRVHSFDFDRREWEESWRTTVAKAQTATVDWPCASTRESVVLP